MALQEYRENRNSYAVMRWIDDGNRVSVHHFKYIVEPKRHFSSYAEGDRGLALFPGFPGQWQFQILAVGESKAVLETWLKRNKNGNKDVTEKPITEKKKNTENIKEKEKSNSNKDVTEKPITEKKKNTENIKEKEKSNTKLMIDQSQKELASILLKRPRESPKDTLQQDVNELKDEVKRLKRRVRELERTETRGLPQSSPPPPSPLPAYPQPPPACHSLSSTHPTVASPRTPPSSFSSHTFPSQLTVTESVSVNTALYNGHSLDSLKDSIAHFDSLFDCCHTLLLKLFSVEYLTSHSVSGQKSNSKTPAKPKFSEHLYSAMKLIIKQKFPNIKDAEITLKVQSVQKKYQKKSGNN